NRNHADCIVIIRPALVRTGRYGPPNRSAGSHRAGRSACCCRSVRCAGEPRSRAGTTVDRTGDGRRAAACAGHRGRAADNRAAATDRATRSLERSLSVTRSLLSFLAAAVVFAAVALPTEADAAELRTQDPRPIPEAPPVTEVPPAADAEDSPLVPLEV